MSWSSCGAHPDRTKGTRSPGPGHLGTGFTEGHVRQSERTGRSDPMRIPEITLDRSTPEVLKKPVRLGFLGFGTGARRPEPRLARGVHQGLRGRTRRHAGDRHRSADLLGDLAHRVVRQLLEPGRRSLTRMNRHAGHRRPAEPGHRVDAPGHQRHHERVGPPAVRDRPAQRAAAECRGHGAAGDAGGAVPRSRVGTSGPAVATNDPVPAPAPDERLVVSPRRIGTRRVA